MLARVKQDYRWNIVWAFAGHDYIKGEWRVVPHGCEDEAMRHPYLDVQEPQAETTESEQKDVEVKASPQAERLALDLGVSLLDVTGTGKEGTIKKGDVEKYVEDHQ